MKHVFAPVACMTVAAGMAFAQPAGPPTVVIVNQAADAIVNYLKLEKPLGKGATREMVFAALRQTVDQYPGSGVSHVFWNVNYQRVAYRSAVWPSYWDVPDPEKNVTEWPRSYYELHKLGIDDVFAIVIPRCRERGVSPWISLRMNDHHYTGDPSRVSPLFFEHPELRTRGGKGLFNYAKPEVREHYLKLAAEVLLRYDVDGLELDWIRTADNFNVGEIERGREILTDFVRAVRRETQAAALRRGHPVQLAVRVPARPEFAHGLGFDVVAWAREGLVDMVIPSDFWNGFADLPVEEWRVQIGIGARQCRIVPFTGTTYACTRKGSLMSRNLAAMRGFAASMLDRGADGIYFFNNFQPVDSSVRLRSPEGKEVVDSQVADLLRAASDLPGAMANPRVHAVSIYETLPPKSSYQQFLPAEIMPQKSVTLKIHTGPKPAAGRCVIRVGLDESGDLKSAQLSVRLNGFDCRALEDLPAPAKSDPRKELPRMNVCEVAPRLTQFEAPLDAVVRGYNSVDVAVEHGGRQTVIWLEILMDPARAAQTDGLDQALALAHKTLDYVQRSRPCPALAAALMDLERRAKALGPEASVPRAELCQSVRQLRRQILFSHPLLDFDRLLVNKCPPPAYSHQSRQYLGRYSRPGPGLAVLEHWKDSPREIPLLTEKLPAGTVMHPDLSFDARRVTFAFCDHTPSDPNLRQFFLWEVGIDGQGLRQLTGKAEDRLAGAEGRQTALIEDFDPCYLPGGGIAFVSTRTQTHIRCQYGFRYFANFLLHRADADGGNIRPLSFAEAPEWEPSVLDDGRILYSRWDYTNRHSYHFQSPWVTRPDGTATANVYGNLTRNPVNTGEPVQVPGSHKIVCTAMAHHGYTAGSIVLVDPRRGLDGLAPIERITPEIAFPESEGWPEGAYANPFPLSEDLFLAAYTPEPLAREGRVQSIAAYGIYLVDRLGGRELIYRDPAMSCFSPIPIQPRPLPPVLPPAPKEKAETGMGVFYVENVYRSTQPIASGSIKSLRVVKVFPQTVESPPSRSITPYEMPKQIVGTAPVGEDGSVAFRAPAGQPLFFQLLDENGMAAMTMRALVYLQPGETASCVGCHEPRHVAPESRRNVLAAGCAPVSEGGGGDSPAASGAIIHDLRPPVGPRYEGGLSFARTVQPVLDRHCIGCHGLERTEGGMDLLGTLEPVTFPRSQWPGPNKMTVSRSYRSLVSREGLVKVAHADMETDFSTPKDYFAHAGRLAKMLLAGHPDQAGRPLVKLDRESFHRIVDWLDLNAVCYGDYSWNKLEWRTPLPDGERALRDHLRARFGPGFAAAPFAALVNVALPEESRALKAPLAATAGGWGQFPETGWTGTGDADYLATRRLVEAAIAPSPAHDIAGTCGRADKCLCDSCWVRRAGETVTQSR